MKQKRNRLPTAMRALVILTLAWLSSVHYGDEDYLLFAGDCLIGLLIAANWAHPFVVARFKGGDKYR